MEAGASTRTSTGGVLDAVPLPFGLRDRLCEMAPVAGLAPARTRLKGEALGSLHSRAFDEMAERGGHAPHHAKCATISLAKSPGSLVRFTFHGAHGESCTRTDPLLRRMSLLLDYAGKIVNLHADGSHSPRYVHEDGAMVETPAAILEATPATPRTRRFSQADSRGRRGERIVLPVGFAPTLRGV